MKLNKDGKVCLECKTELARQWGNNFCESCFRRLLKESLKKEQKEHAE